MSFSPHTDAKGIMDLVGYLSPAHVILVHGEKPKMTVLKGRIQSELGIPCYDPANNETVLIPTTRIVQVEASKMFVKSCHANASKINCSLIGITDSQLDHIEVSQSNKDNITTKGILVMEKSKTANLVCESELLQKLGEPEHNVRFTCCFPVYVSEERPISHHIVNGYPVSVEDSSTELNSPQGSMDKNTISFTNGSLLNSVRAKLKNLINHKSVIQTSEHLLLDSFKIQICSRFDCPYRREKEDNSGKRAIFFCCSWLLVDEELAKKLLAIMRGSHLTMGHTVESATS